jgi:hypothetical protein
MAILKNDATGEEFTLGLRALIGRGFTCAIQVGDRRVSGEHALIAWTDGRWQLRDLGSRNGTFAGGQRLPSGELYPLSLDEPFALGDASATWRLVEDSAPAAQARDLTGAAVVTGSSGLLLLPSERRAELSVRWGQDGSWYVERLVEPFAGVREVTDLEVVHAGGLAWRLHLPRPLSPTLNADQAGGPALSFAVGADGRCVSLTVEYGGQSRPVDLDLCGELPLALAEAREAASDLNPIERGWVTPETLAARLGCLPSSLALRVNLAWRALEQAGAPDPSMVLERRSSTGQLRLGGVRFEVRR